MRTELAFRLNSGCDKPKPTSTRAISVSLRMAKATLSSSVLPHSCPRCYSSECLMSRHVSIRIRPLTRIRSCQRSSSHRRTRALCSRTRLTPKAAKAALERPKRQPSPQSLHLADTFHTLAGEKVLAGMALAGWRRTSTWRSSTYTTRLHPPTGLDPFAQLSIWSALVLRHYFQTIVDILIDSFI